MMRKNGFKINSRVSFYNICFEDNCGWFCDVYSNTLCRIDIDTATISVEAMIPFDGNTRPFQYGFIAKAGDILVLAPRAAATVMIYNIPDKVFHRVELDARTIEKIGAVNLFSGVEIFGDSAYLIPGRFPGIVKLDLSTKKITNLDDWYVLLTQKISDFDPRKVIFARCSSRERNNLYLPSWQSGVIMIFDMETEKYSFMNMPRADVALSSICIMSDDIWVASGETNIVTEINEISGEMHPIVLPEIVGTGITFLSQCGRSLYAVPVWGDQLIRLDLETKMCSNVHNLVTEPIDMPPELIFAQTNMLSCVNDPKGQIWMYSIFDGKIYRINNLGDVEIFDACIKTQEDINCRVNFYMKKLLSQGILDESSQYGLEEYLEYICEAE